MDQLPGLRPTSPSIDRSNATPREHGLADEAGGPSRFDERLNQVSERRAALQHRDEPSRAEDATSRARPEARVEKHSQDKAVNGPDARDRSERAKPDTSVAAQEKQTSDVSRDSGAQKLRARSADRAESASAPEAEATSDPKPAPVSIEIELKTPAAAPATPSTPAQIGAETLAAALATPQAKLLETPAIAMAGNTAEAIAAIVDDSSAAMSPSSKEQGLEAKKSDNAPSTSPDASLRAGLGTVDHARDFDRELTQLRESIDTRTLHAERAHIANDSAAEILRQVRVGLSADLREATIQLAPESLGRVSIRLRVEHGVMTADVRAESVQALRALELHAPELKAALAGHGVSPRTLEFSLSLMNSHTGDAPGRGHASPSNSPRASMNPFDLPSVQVERALARHLSASGVDTYA